MSSVAVINKIAVIIVDEKDEVTNFYDWLQRNRDRIFGISMNMGCGCCVDMIHLVIEDNTDKMPCESDGSFEPESIRYGDKRDRLLSDFLD